MSASGQQRRTLFGVVLGVSLHGSVMIREEINSPFIDRGEDGLVNHGYWGRDDITC
jgi:hypothetical protein